MKKKVTGSKDKGTKKVTGKVMKNNNEEARQPKKEAMNKK